MTDKEAMKEMNEYFNELKQCDLPFPHHKGDCSYIGTVGERYAKYLEIVEKKRKREEEDENVVIENTITRKNKKVRYVDNCNSENNPHPYSHMF
jgi:hypothetical protein